MSWYTKSYVGYFDIYAPLTRLLGTSSAFLTLVVGFFASLYLTLRISYRSLLSKVRESVPSLSSMREAVLPNDEDDIPSKKTKVDDTYRRKAEELEKRLETLQKQKK